MLGNIHRTLANPTLWLGGEASGVDGEIRLLRATTLRTLLMLTTAGYLLWNTVATIANPDDRIKYWLVFPLASGSLLATYLVSRRDTGLASLLFLALGVATISVAGIAFGVSAVLFLYPIASLAAVVLFHPLAGLATTGAGALGLLLLSHFGVATEASTARYAEVLAGCILAVIVPSVLWQSMTVAVEWSVTSFADARQRLDEARSHRAQLVRALKQLDIAYYRLERANAALASAWRAAEEAERSKTEFVTNISHELRTPLNLIVGFSEMVATSPATYGEALPPAYRSDIFAIYRSAQHLLTLTDDVIDLAKGAAGRLALSREPLDLGQVIADAADIVREYVEAKGLYLRLEVAPELPAVNADRLRIRQVLLNLLTNAARFTTQGGITVRASSADGTVTVRVVDTGRGIRPEMLPRIFDEFQHDPAASPREPGAIGGTGLGLSISKTFVELHGGRIGVESRLGEGTMLWFELPTSSVSATTVVKSSATRKETHERVIVLLTSEIGLGRFLEQHIRGARVLTAASPKAAVTTAVESRASAILVDPDVDFAVGSESVPVPVVRIPLPVGDRLARTVGARACLAKPLRREDLRSTIAAISSAVDRVLVVDDDAEFVHLISRFLAADAPKPALRVIQAYGGREALDQMRATRPDLVLLDLAMPDIDGPNVIAAMREDPRLADVPVVVVSGQEHEGWERVEKRLVSLERAEGFGLEELIRLTEAVLDSLDPPRGYLLDGPTGRDRL